ncbi:AAA family ATPase [Calothrix sp. NIES-2098]|uniref:AAA family ATPase n=1 Tax=Calothrix sp. NIES-2098 TaxID=1954171 RepID=UPI0030DA47D7
MSSALTASSDIVRRALEQAMRHHQLTALMVDEAQHLLMLAGGKQMLHQMNWIKSIANITGTVHILFGTYDLLNCCRLSGQVNRRSDDIHLPRYLSDSKEDVTEFIRVLQTFQTHIPCAIRWLETRPHKDSRGLTARFKPR